jgi:hypothetical protein
MDTAAIIPDAPFRSGTTGKYKLLIRSMTPKFNGYEYELVDADGKEYKAASPKHYAPDQLLRCMVHFKVANASFVVTETLICSKQDLATAIPEPPKPKPKPEPKQTVSVARGMLGDPIKSRVSGVYKLLVVEVVRGDKKNSYVLEDAIGRKYKYQGKKYYKEGSIVGCQVNTLITKGGLKATVASMGKHPKASKSHRGHSSRGGHDWLPAPPVGTHIHIIYTPMGNKR